jgi:hypothetical protein
MQHFLHSRDLYQKSCSCLDYPNRSWPRLLLVTFFLIVTFGWVMLPSNCVLLSFHIFPITQLNLFCSLSRPSTVPRALVEDNTTFDQFAQNVRPFLHITFFRFAYHVLSDCKSLPLGSAHHVLLTCISRPSALGYARQVTLSSHLCSPYRRPSATQLHVPS